MKIIFLVLCFLNFSAFAGETASLLNGKLFVPQGFDSNDPAEVIIYGVLPDLCHRNPTYEVSRQGSVFTIYLYAYFVPLDTCRKISVPYMEKVTLGVLPEGSYQVRLMDFRTPISIENIKVEKAPRSLQDNFNYGNVMAIRPLANRRQIELLGTNPVDCLKFEKIETRIQEKVIVLLPQFKEIGRCKEVPTTFRIVYDLPPVNGHHETLIHVRVMDGRSYNYIYKN